MKWGRAFKKNGVERLSLYHTSKEAVQDAYLSTLCGISETIGIVNLNTEEEWTYENGKLQTILQKYKRHIGDY